MSDYELSRELQLFAEENIGNLADIGRAPSGQSRVTWLLKGEKRRAVIREDAGDGPMAGTSFSLDREKRVYEILNGSGIRAPELMGSTSNALLLEWAAGQADLPEDDLQQREHLIEGYVDALAELHSLPQDAEWSRLNPPPNASESALSIVQEWVDYYRNRVRRPSPLAEITSRWLLDNAPTDSDRLSLCHGDVGPGNFMHENGVVTALIDWEFSHVGDPMHDFAWLAFRGHHFHGDLGDFSAQVARWEANTGRTASYRRIEYYRVLVMYIFLVTSLAALDNGAKKLNRFVFLGIIPMAEVLIPKAILMFEGRELPSGCVGVSPTANEISEHLEALVDLIGMQGEVLGACVDAAGQVARLNAVLTEVIKENTVHLSEYVGRKLRPESHLPDFLKWVKNNPEKDADSLAVIYANGQRRIEHESFKPIANRELLDLQRH